MDTLEEIITSAFSSNDVAKITEILEQHNFSRDCHGFHSIEDKHIANFILGTASAREYSSGLSDELKAKLIECTATQVELYIFIRFVIMASQNKASDSDIIPPQNVRSALTQNNFTSEIAKTIEDMDDATFDALLSFIMLATEEVLVDFNAPIIRTVYKKKVIPDNLMLAYMGMSLKDSLEEAISYILSIF